MKTCRSFFERFSIVGLPHQTVEFQYCARALRLVCEDHKRTKEQKIQDIKERMVQMNEMIENLGEFIINQCEDGELSRL